MAAHFDDDEEQKFVGISDSYVDLLPPSYSNTFYSRNNFSG